jgi:hypothetical protein
MQHIDLGKLSNLSQRFLQPIPDPVATVYSGAIGLTHTPCGHYARGRQVPSRLCDAGSG